MLVVSPLLAPLLAATGSRIPQGAQENLPGDVAAFEVQHARADAACLGQKQRIFGDKRAALVCSSLGHGVAAKTILPCRPSSRPDGKSRAAEQCPAWPDTPRFRHRLVVHRISFFSRTIERVVSERNKLADVFYLSDLTFLLRDFYPHHIAKRYHAKYVAFALHLGKEDTFVITTFDDKCFPRYNSLLILSCV